MLNGKVNTNLKFYEIAPCLARGAGFERSDKVAKTF